MRSIIIVIISAAFAISCRKEATLPASESGRITVSVEDTKASPRTTVSDFVMFGYVYQEEDGIGKANYMYAEKMTKTGSSYVSQLMHVSVPKGNTVYFWAVDPYSSNGVTLPDRNYSGEPYFIYDNPADVSSQQDILVSAYTSDGFSVSAPVNMSFTHLLHGIRFAFAEGGAFSGTVHSITIENIKTHGVYDLKTGWRDQSVKEDRTLVLNKAVTTAFSNCDLTTDDQTFMILPQTAGGDCDLVFDITKDGVRKKWRRTISGSVLKQGELQTYKLNFN